LKLNRKFIKGKKQQKKQLLQIREQRKRLQLERVLLPTTQLMNHRSSKFQSTGAST